MKPVTVAVSVQSVGGRAQLCYVSDPSVGDAKDAFEAVELLPENMKERLREDVDMRTRGFIGRIRYYPSIDDYEWL